MHKLTDQIYYTPPVAETDRPVLALVRGAGRALILDASRLARAGGARGRVALQAENPRALAVYQRLGFVRMRPSDAPLALVPRGGKGWSAPVLRLARGEAGRDQDGSPWMVLDPDRVAAGAAVHVLRRRGAASVPPAGAGVSA